MTPLNRLIVVADQGDRDAWLEGRQGGLGGSDLSAICGENPFKSAIDVWESIINPDPFLTLAASDRLDMGQILEPPIMQAAARGAKMWPRPGNPWKLWRPPLVARKGLEWQRGSCDGLGIDSEVADYIADCFAFRDLLPPPGTVPWWERVVEVKTHGLMGGRVYSDNPFDDEPVPADKVIQTTWYGDLWDIEMISLVVLIDTHMRRYWSWKRDLELSASLLQIAEDWWRKHIVGGITPDPDGTKKFNDYLGRKFPKAVSGTSARATPALDAEVTNLRAAWLAQKAAEAEYDRLKQIMQSSMGTIERMDTHLGPLTWRNQDGRLKPREALDAAYKRLGWGAAQIEEHEAQFKGDAIRVFNVPHAQWKKAKQ